MNRQIIFRGKRLDNGEWVTDSETYISDADGTWLYDGSDVVKVDEKTIGQFTGLHDKNGKEIYEDDILKMACADVTVEYYRVVWHKAGFHLDMRQYGYDPLGNIDRGLIEVVGNIYETPELLKGGEQ